MLKNIDYEPLIEFTQKLIKTPSFSGEERKIAEIIMEKMKELGYDEVWMDNKLNVIGKIKGSGGGPTLLFNGHTDHAKIGEMENPFSGEIINGKKFDYDGDVIYGRGASDMKAGIAAMIYAVGAAKEKLSLKGDVIMTATSLEELAYGEGIEFLLKEDNITADFAVSGEATNLNVYVGHRGHVDWRITTRGKTSHAGNPGGGTNALYLMNQFINAVHEQYPIRQHEFLGDVTFTYTDISVSPGLNSVIPDRCELLFDNRFYPGDTREQLETYILEIFERLEKEIPDFKAEVELDKWFPAMFTEPGEEVVQAMLEARRKVLNFDNGVGSWYFGSEATYLNQAGIPTVGFGPANEYVAHTPEDHVPVNHITKAAEVYFQFIKELVC